MEPRSATAITEIAPEMPRAVSRVPSSGSTATSTSGPVPSPTSSPLNSMGASSFSPSPITTMPRIETELTMKRMRSTAAWSAAFLSPRPIQREAPMAAASVTPTSSSARFRSGGVREAPSLIARPILPPRSRCRRRGRASTSHALRGLDAEQVEADGDHRLRGRAERQAEALCLRLEHAVVVVEAVEVVRDADRVRREGVRAAALRRLPHDAGQLEKPLHELTLLGRERPRGPGVGLARFRVPQDARDPRVRVLHVVDGVLLAPLRGEVDVDLDRLVVSAGQEVPARRVDPDLL